MTTNDKTATVFGGTGFLGRAIVARLSQDGWRVRVAARRPEAFEAPEGTDGEIEPIYADVRDETSVGLAVADVQGVVNAVGLYAEQGAETFNAVHVLGALDVARQARRAGARLVHISGIGVDPHSPSAYVRARAEGDLQVGQEYGDATVLRPSVLFGPGDAFFTSLAAATRSAPVMPLFGAGGTRLQPVYVGDVAHAVAAALDDPQTAGVTYDLGGAAVYTYRELIELVLARTARKRWLLPVPFAIWEGVARVASALPNPPVTRDMIALMGDDNVVPDNARGFAELGIEPARVEDILPTYIG